MNTKKITTSLVGSITAAALIATTALPLVSAQTLGEMHASAEIKTGDSTTTKASVRAAAQVQKQAANEANSKTRADKEIDQRIEALNKLVTRVQAMKHITDGNKTSLVTSIQVQITTLTTLKAKIDADIDTTILKTDIQSITKSLRIYALVLPEASLIASADRMLDISASMTTIGTKLQTRIAQVQTAGKDVTSLQAALTDYTAKLADANTQAQASITAVAGLTPDNGDTTKAAANRQALIAARANIKTGTQDLKTARQDAEKILRALRGVEPKPAKPEHATTTENSH